MIIFIISLLPSPMVIFFENLSAFGVVMGKSGVPVFFDSRGSNSRNMTANSGVTSPFALPSMWAPCPPPRSEIVRQSDLVDTDLQTAQRT